MSIAKGFVIIVTYNDIMEFQNCNIAFKEDAFLLSEIDPSKLKPSELIKKELKTVDETIKLIMEENSKFRKIVNKKDTAGWYNFITNNLSYIDCPSIIAMEPDSYQRLDEMGVRTVLKAEEGDRAIISVGKKVSGSFITDFGHTYYIELSEKEIGANSILRIAKKDEIQDSSEPPDLKWEYDAHELIIPFTELEDFSEFCDKLTENKEMCKDKRKVYIAE